MRKRLFIGSGATLGVLIAGFGAYHVWQLTGPSTRISVSPQTTFITDPLADDGLPDYAAHLLGKMKKGVTPENNGAIPFLQAMWPAELETNGRLAICTELSMRIPRTHGLCDPKSDHELIDKLSTKLIAHYPELKSSGEEYAAALLDLAQEQPWQREELPELADWLESHHNEFDLLYQAARSEQFYLPSPSLLTSPKSSHSVLLLPHLQTLRYAVRCLVTRAFLSIESGDLEKAWEDCKTAYLLGENAKQQYLVGEIVSINCDDMAGRIALSILGQPDLPPQLATEMQEFLISRKSRDGVRWCLDQMERLQLITTVLELSGQREPEDTSLEYVDGIEGVVRIVEKSSIDWNWVLRRVNDWHDKLDDALAEYTFSSRQVAVDAVMAELEQHAEASVGVMLGSALSRQQRSNNVATIVTMLMLPAVDTALDFEYRANAKLQLLQVAAELAVYRSTHGSYPESLADLSASENSYVDPFGNPLCYRPIHDGYLLYSTGFDGEDDNGSSMSDSKFQGYDLPETKAEEIAIRERLEVRKHPSPFIRGYQSLTPPENSDDIAIRLPLIHRPLPQFEPTSE